LVNNPAWAGQIATQLDEARRDFPNATVDINVFAPSTGVFTLFFSTSHDDGALYVPNYSIQVVDEGLFRRMYVGELAEANNIELPPTTFSEVIRKYYYGDIGNLVMRMTFGAYEPRDDEILDDFNLYYTKLQMRP
jgi:hypothetical protein